MPTEAREGTLTRAPGAADAVHAWRPTQVRAHPTRPAKGVQGSLSPVRPRYALLATARSARSLEPILFPKLRIWFADFPYLHCSIGQRLFTSETCCGYGYELARKLHRLPRIFTGRLGRTGRDKRRRALRGTGPYLRANRFQGRRPLPRKENSSRGSSQRLRVRLRYRAKPRKADLRVEVREC